MSTNSSAPRTASPRTRILLPFLLIAATVALIFVGISLRQAARPGMRHYHAGMEAVSQHHLDVAEREWKLGTNEDPDFAPCYEQLGELYAALHRSQDAEANFARAASLSPSDGSLFLRLSRMQHVNAKWEEAFQSAKRAAELMPNDPDAQGGYGILAAERRNTAIALTALRKALTLETRTKESGQYRLALAEVELDNLDYDGVERDLTPYLQAHPDPKDPNYVKANYFMAVVYNQRPRTPENVEKALTFAQTAYPEMSTDARIYSLLGQLFLAKNGVQDALNCYLAGRERAPASEDMLHGLVQCYARLGDTKRQKIAAAQFQVLTARHNRIQHLKHLLGFNHHDVAAGLELAHLWELDGQWREAAKLYQGIAQEMPGDVRAQKAFTDFKTRIQAKFGNTGMPPTNGEK